MSADLRIFLTAADEAFPVTGSVVTILAADGRELYSEIVSTESEGRSGPFKLFAPSIPSDEPDEPGPKPYSKYTVLIKSKRYYNIRIEGVQMFDGFDSTLPVWMIPLPEEGVDADLYPEKLYLIGDNVLNEDSPRPDADTQPSDSYIPAILESVYIPSRIRVHLGAPDSDAQNVSVNFPDYIKNVASSEIYPTWPEESLRANIIAQISLALNRIFTEWYPSRGYNFDITNSTAYDQYFVYGRNIFDSVSRIVDEIFSTYLRRPGRIEPYFAEYCNGSSVSCAGMSQWGTVSLAQQGLDAETILQFYYGDVETVVTDDVRQIEESYPGFPLKVGSSGENVRTLQEQLNRVAINYPSVGLTPSDAVFGEDTRRSVINFQRLFNLTPDGVVGRATWYRLSYIYAAIKKLAELTSEGQREEYNTTEYPGFILRRGSRGSEVQQIQFYLSRIALFNPAIAEVKIDGIYGLTTQNAVLAFQRYYGLDIDGVVGKATWDKIASVYIGTEDSPDAPEKVRPYPGAPVALGSRGENAVYVQTILNYVTSAFPGLKKVVVDGVFGRLSVDALKDFQSLFGLSADGVAGRSTWEVLNRVYLSVSKNCIESAPNASDIKAYPGYVIYVGSAGSNVRYVQNLLDVISKIFAPLGPITADGVFGRGTQNKVKAFQSLFGLASDGSVGKATWDKLNRIYSAVLAGCFAPSSLSASAFEELSVFSPSFDIPPIPRFRNSPISIGAFGESIVEFKRVFFEKTGISMGESALFGAKSAAILRQFQISRSLEPTAILDEATWQALFEVG